MKQLNTSVQEFITYLEVEKRYASNTIRNYTHCLQQFIEFIHDNHVRPLIEEISLKNISAFREYIYKRHF